MKKKIKSGIIPKKNRPWFYAKNGDVKHVVTYPINSNGAPIKEKSKTICGGLRNKEI